MIQLFQAVSAVLWAVTAIWAFPSIWRTFTFRPIEQDNERGIFFYFGLIQVGAWLRWCVFSRAIAGMGVAELNIWAALYLSLIALAFRTMVVMRRRRL